MGNGAGCPTFVADSGAKFQTLLVNSINSPLEMVSSRPSFFLLSNVPLEKTSMYSCVSLSIGLTAD